MQEVNGTGIRASLLYVYALVQIFSRLHIQETFRPSD